MNFKHINYDELNAKQKETYNFQKLASVLADYGFNCIKLSDDWNGADFLALHKDGELTLKVQLKARLTIDKKYTGKDLHIAFPENKVWYLVLHDQLIHIVGETTDWLNSKSWTQYGSYSSANPSQELLNSLSDYALGIKANTDEQVTEVSKPSSTPAKLGSNHSSQNRIKKSVYIKKELIGTEHVECFQHDGITYSVPHDELLSIVEEVTPWLDSPSWENNGAYGSSSPSKALLARLYKYAVSE